MCLSVADFPNDFADGCRWKTKNFQNKRVPQTDKLVQQYGQHDQQVQQAVSSPSARGKHTYSFSYLLHTLTVMTSHQSWHTCTGQYIYQYVLRTMHVWTKAMITCLECWWWYKKGFINYIFFTLVCFETMVINDVLHIWQSVHLFLIIFRELYLAVRLLKWCVLHRFSCHRFIFENSATVVS